MPELRDLPDLARDVRERAVPPAYEEVGRRVRARRRRTLAGTLAATVLVVTGVAVWQTMEASPGPGPAEPATPFPSTSEQLWRSVVAGKMAHPFEVAGSADGSVAVIWRSLVHPEPTFALVIRHPDGTVIGTRLDEPVELTPVPGGWVGVRTAQGFFIGTDGTWTDLGWPGEARAPERGDVVVSGQLGRYLFSPADRTWSTLATEQPVDQAYVTRDGNLVTCARVGENRIHIRRGASQLSLVALADGNSCVLTANGDTASVLALGDGPDGDTPLTSLLRSADGGVSWVTPSHEALSSVTSQAVTSSGTIVVSGNDGRSFAVGADGSYAEPDVDLGVVFAAGDRLYATSYAQSKGPLLYSDDDGATWQETTVPGLG